MTLCDHINIQLYAEDIEDSQYHHVSTWNNENMSGNNDHCPKFECKCMNILQKF